MVTKRGTNEMARQSARYFYAPERWEADNTPAQVNVDDLATSRTIVLRDYGVEAGGALLKDRLWFWGGWGQNQINVQKVGHLDTNGHPVADILDLENFDAKLDAQIAASNSLEFYYHHGDRVQYGRGASTDVAPEAAINLTQPVPIYNLEDTQVFSPSLTASAFFSYMDFTQTATPVGGVDTPMYLDPEFVLRGSSPPSMNHSIVRQGGVSASKFFTTGSLSHELKVGFGYRYAESQASSSVPGGQVWGDEGDGWAYISRSALSATQEKRIGAYVSDTLTSDRLTVNAGVRYDYARARNGPASVPANPQYPDLLPAVQYAGDQGYPISAGSWQPRVGATYALGEKRTTLVRASYSRFADLYLDGINFSSPFPSTQGLYYYWTDTNGNHRVDPGEVDFNGGLVGFYGLDPAKPGSSAAPNQISPHLKPTTVDEAVIGFDQELFGGLTASVHYTYRSIRAVVFTPYIGVTPGGGGYEYAGNASGSVTDPYGFGLAFDVPYYGLTIDPPPTGSVLRNRPGYSQTYQGVGVQLVRAFSDRWLLRGTFAWNSWRQSVTPESIFDPNDVPGGPNRNGGEVTSGSVASAWTFSVSGLYQLPLGFTVSGALAGRQGFPEQYYVLVDPHDTLGGQIAVLTAPIGTYRLPDVYELDLRVANTFKAGPVSLTPSLSVFNATNANTVLARRLQTGTYNSARDVPFRPDSRFNEISDFESPRIFQVGLQIAF